MNRSEQSAGFFGRPANKPAKGPLGKILAVLVGGLLLALGVMFSLLALAVVVLVGALVYGYFYWQTRHLRRHLQEAMAPQARAAHADSAAGQIIEGEAIRETAQQSPPSTGEQRRNLGSPPEAPATNPAADKV